MAASSNPWSDFETVITQLRQMTVPSLKSVITGIVDQSAANIGKTGKKADLHDRIVRALRVLQSEGKVDRWLKARAVVLQAAAGNEYDPSTLSQFQPNASTTSAAPRYNQNYGSSSASTSYYAGSSRPVLPATSPLRPSTGHPVPKWKHSPFYRIDQVVSTVHECPESASSTDRRSASFNFYVTADHIAKLHSRSGPKYQLRLYCTTSQYYITMGTSFRNNPCPIEFPPTCEVRINNHVLTNANFRGIKKKAGTAPPADITDLCVSTGAGGNRVEMIYVNSNQPAANKQKPIPQKYYLIVNLVEVTPVNELVERLRRRVQPKEKTIANIQAQQVDDDEVQAGPTKLSLRDPLTYTRLNLPCRSTKCVHIQCFDANRWYSMMEQTTTWLCPICDHVLDVDDLIIDEFVSDILQQVPEDTDDVMVEADAEWHTEDNQYGSLSWLRLYGVPRAQKIEVESPPSTKVNSSEEAITIGDSSDSEAEQEVKRELSPPRMVRPLAAPQPTVVVQSGPVVIDLTLDDDSDEETPMASVAPPSSVSRPLPPPSVLGKRKLSSDGELAAGSSRRTSSAPSHRSARADDEDLHPHHDRHISTNTVASNGSHSVAHHSPTSPLAHINTSASSSPAMYHYPNGNPLPSPTNISPPLHHGPSQWTTQQRTPQYQLPPASTLISGLPSPLSRAPPPPPILPPPSVNRQSRPPYDNDHRHSSHGASSSATSRYAEWGLRP